MCERSGCDRPAVGFMALQLFAAPAKCLHDGAAMPLRQFATGPQLCRLHADEVDVASQARTVETIARSTESQTGVVIDRAATKLVLLPFDHPDVLRLQGGEGAQC
jgi:hypothetical protein